MIGIIGEPFLLICPWTSGLHKLWSELVSKKGIWKKKCFLQLNKKKEREEKKRKKGNQESWPMKYELILYKGISILFTLISLPLRAAVLHTSFIL